MSSDGSLSQLPKDGLKPKSQTLEVYYTPRKALDKLEFELRKKQLESETKLIKKGKMTYGIVGGGGLFGGIVTFAPIIKYNELQKQVQVLLGPQQVTMEILANIEPSGLASLNWVFDIGYKDYPYQGISKVEVQFDKGMIQSNEKGVFSYSFPVPSNATRIVKLQFMFNWVGREEQIVFDVSSSVPSTKQQEILYIWGRVVESSGEPIKGLTVVIKDKKRSQQFKVTTDDDGFFVKKDPPEGKYEVYVEAEGFKQIKKEIKVE